MDALYIAIPMRFIVPAQKTPWAVKCQIRACHPKMEIALPSALSTVTKMK
jgi:hypothetical protein